MSHEETASRPRWPVALAVGATVVVVAWAVVDQRTEVAPTMAAAPASPDRRSEPQATSPGTSSSLTTAVPPILSHTVEKGASAADVRLVQQRLTALNFDPGPVDGVYGPATRAAIWAFEKLVLGVPSAQVSGIVTPQTWEVLRTAAPVQPRRPNGSPTHLEIYLPEQVAVLFVDGNPRLVTHISGGAGVEWCDEVLIDNEDGTQTTEGICGRSVTPGGIFHFERKVDGWRNAKLGRLYKPVYFNYGIAVHGATKVPSYPASRGCVRLPMHIAEYFPSLVDIGDEVFVFDGVKEPEAYGAQLPVFDWKDPNFVPPTTAGITTTTGPVALVPTAPAPPATHTHPTESAPTAAQPLTAEATSTVATSTVP